jgi:hypothetical protein
LSREEYAEMKKNVKQLSPKDFAELKKDVNKLSPEEFAEMKENDKSLKHKHPSVVGVSSNKLKSKWGFSGNFFYVSFWGEFCRGK